MRSYSGGVDTLFCANKNLKTFCQSFQNYCLLPATFWTVKYVSLFSFPSHIFARAPFIIIITVYRNVEAIACGWLATDLNVRVMFRTYRSDGLRSEWTNRQTDSTVIS